jgi:hypothetical protein
MAIRLPPGFGQVDVLSVVNRDDLRIGSTPFGPQPINYYIGKAVPWKGFTINPGEDFATYITRLKAMNPKVGAGLEAAVAMGSVKGKGAKGVVIAKINGVRKKMPRYAYDLAKAGKNKTNVGKVEKEGTSAGAIRLTPSA